MTDYPNPETAAFSKAIHGDPGLLTAVLNLCLREHNNTGVVAHVAYWCGVARILPPIQELVIPVGGIEAFGKVKVSVLNDLVTTVGNLAAVDVDVIAAEITQDFLNPPPGLNHEGEQVT